MENTLNLTSETNASQKLTKEVLDYKIEKDGKGGEYQVINLDHPKWAATSGIVEIVPTRFAKGVMNSKGIEPKRHEADVSFFSLKCKESGYHIGVVAGRDKDGALVWRRVSVKGTEFLNLANPEERRKFILFKYGPFYKGSPNFVKTCKTAYDIVDREEEARVFVQERQKRVKASDIVAKLWGEELADAGLLMGFDPKTMSTDTLLMKCIKYVEDDKKDVVSGKKGSEIFLEYWNGPSRVERVIFKRALSTGVLTYNPGENSYNYNNVSIGHSEEEAVLYLKENQSRLASIDAQSRSNSNNSTSVANSSVKDSNDEMSATLERQRREIEELKKQIAQSPKGATSHKEEESDADTELENLLKEAKDLEVKSYHLLGRNSPVEVRKQKLRDAIAEVKNQATN